MATKAEVKTQTLENLGIIGVGRTAASQHDTRMDTAYTQVYNDLKSEGLATWAEAGTSIPDEVAPFLAGLMALNAHLPYGISQMRLNRLYADFGQNGILAKREIRRLTTPDYESLEEPDDF